MVIAIDGPAGAGKSSVCRLLAGQLGYVYLDTGAMYRAVAWVLYQEGVDVGNEAQVDRTLSRLPLRFVVTNGALDIFFEGKALNEELRQPEVSQWASAVSQIQSVRAFLTQWQKRLASQGNVIAEGRDMTTVVFPDAPVKVFLTADLATRARRRFAEYRQKGVPMDYGALEAQIRDRDKADEERKLAPLRVAPDAFFLDTSQLGLEEVVDRIRDFMVQQGRE